MLFDGEHRELFRGCLGVDEPIDSDTWERARGWALSLGLAYLASSSDNDSMLDLGLRTVHNVLEG